MHLMDLSEEEIMGLEEDVFYKLLAESAMPCYNGTEEELLVKFKNQCSLEEAKQTCIVAIQATNIIFEQIQED